MHTYAGAHYFRVHPALLMLMDSTVAVAATMVLMAAATTY
jgi:hypothetical protein